MGVLSLGTQTSCHTTARRLQSSRTTAGTLAVTFDEEIDLAGSEGLERMKIVNIKSRRPLHLPRWSRCNRAVRTMSTPRQDQPMCGVVGNTWELMGTPTSHSWMPGTGPQKGAVTPVKSRVFSLTCARLGHSARPLLGTSGIRALAVRAGPSAAPKPSMTGADSPRATPHRCQSRTPQPTLDSFRAFPWAATVVSQGRSGSGS